MTRTKKVLKNSVFSIAQQLVNIITNILIPPIIIATFGSAINGLISTIKQLVSYIQLLEAGLTTSATESLYKPLAKDDKDTINGYLNAINKAFNKVGIYFSIITIAVALIYPFFIYRENITYSTIVLLILSIGITGASEFFIIGKCKTLLIADQKIFIVSIAQIVGNILNVITVITLVYLKQNIVLIHFLSSTFYACRMIILTLYIKRHYKYLDKSKPPISEATSKRKDALFHQLAGVVVSGGTTIIVSIFCGLKAASIYAVYSLIFMGVNSICSVLSSALVPSFGEIAANDDKTTLNKTYDLYQVIYYIIISVFFAVTLVMILPFISIYTGGADINYSNQVLAVLFIIFGLGTNLKMPAVTVIIAHGKFKETKHLAIIETVISLIGQMIFVKLFGLEGVMLGSICSMIYRTISTIIYANKHILNVSNKITIKRILVNIIPTFLIAYFILTKFNLDPNGYIEWISDAVLVTILIGVTGLVFNYIFDKSACKKLFNRIKNIF